MTLVLSILNKTRKLADIVESITNFKWHDSIPLHMVLQPLSKLTSGPPELPYCESTKQQKMFLLTVNLEQKTVKIDQQKQERYFFQSIINNHGICLDLVHVSVLEAQLQAVALGSADNAIGDGDLQGERASHCHQKLPGTQV